MKEFAELLQGIAAIGWVVLVFIIVNLSST
jgi:hypothetical protein